MKCNLFIQYIFTWALTSCLLAPAAFVQNAPSGDDNFRLLSSGVDSASQDGKQQAILDRGFHVSPQGVDDVERDGSSQEPWRTLGYALSRLPEKLLMPYRINTIIVEPGEYPRVSTTRQFEYPVILQARVPHQSFILPDEEHGPVLFNYSKHITLEGFVIDNRNNKAASNVVHLLGGSSYIRLRNNIITHGGAGYPYADAVKIHRGVQHVIIEDNVIFDAMDEEIDIAEDVDDVILRRNVIYRNNILRTEPLLSIKNQSRRIVLDANVFLNGTIRIGGGITAGQETFDVFAVHNLFLGGVNLAGCERALLAKNVFLDRTEGGNFISMNRRYPNAQPAISLKSVYIANNTFQWRNMNKEFPTGQENNPIVYSHNRYWKQDGGTINPQILTHDSNPIVEDPKFKIESIQGRSPSLDWLNAVHLSKEGAAYQMNQPPMDLGFSLKDHMPDRLTKFVKNYLEDYDWYVKLRMSRYSGIQKIHD